jgi:hypothetical protein
VLFKNDDGWEMIVVLFDDESMVFIRLGFGKGTEVVVIIGSLIEGIEIAVFICVWGTEATREIFVGFIGGRCIGSDEKLVIDS